MVQNNQKGSIPLLILVAVVGLIIFIFAANFLSFKDNIFSTLFPKPKSLAAANNFLQNNSFETVGTGTAWLTPWYTKNTPIASQSATFTQDSTAKVDGNYSFKVSIPTANPSDKDEVQLSQRSLNLVAGTTLTINFWAKASVNRNINIGINEALTPFTLYYLYNLPLTTSWKQYTLFFTPTISDTDVALRFNMSEATGQIWIDNVSYSDSAPTSSGVNLVTNTGCESSTAGWNSFQAVLTRVTNIFRSGVASCKVTSNGVFTGGQSFTIDGGGGAFRLTNIATGSGYLVKAWVRSDTVSTKSAQLVLRQKGDTTIATYSKAVTLSPSWQLLELGTTIAIGKNTLETYIQQNQASIGDLFYADDISVHAVAAPSPTPTTNPLSAPITPTTAPSINPTLTPTQTPVPSILGDIDNDRDVDIFDYNQFVSDYGKSGTGIISDIDKDGDVDIFDYNFIVQNFGKTS